MFFAFSVSGCTFNPESGNGNGNGNGKGKRKSNRTFYWPQVMVAIDPHN